MAETPEAGTIKGDPEAVIYLNIQQGIMSLLEFQMWLSDMRDASYHQGIEIGQESCYLGDI